MNIAAALVLGLLLGWLIEWVIDWFYWRRGLHTTPVEANHPAEEQYAALLKANKDLEQANIELKDRVTALQADLDTIAVTAATAHLIDKDGNHNLQAIKGIGPTFSKRLKEAGINTFEELSQLTPEEMEKILGTLFKRFFSKENTILEQAREFGEQMTRRGKGK